MTKFILKIYIYIFCSLYNANYSTVLGRLSKRYNTFNNGWTIKRYDNK